MVSNNFKYLKTLKEFLQIQMQVRFIKSQNLLPLKKIIKKVWNLKKKIVFSKIILEITQILKEINFQ